MFAIQDIFKEDVEYCENNNIPHIMFNYDPITKFSIDIGKYKDENWILRGSVTVANILRRDTKWNIFYNPPSFRCEFYYEYLYEYLLNTPYLMTPIGNLRRSKDMLFEAFWCGELFIRPCSGFKHFAGQTIMEDNWDHVLDGIYLENIDPAEMVLVSKARPLEEEYRFVVIEDEILDGCQYMNRGEQEEKRAISVAAWGFLDKMLKKDLYRPDDVYVVDVGMTGGFPKIVELNSFTCAGLYECDRGQIFREVQKYVGQ